MRFWFARSEEEESSTIYVVGVELPRSIEDRGTYAATLGTRKAANGARSASFISLRRILEEAME